MQRVSWRLRRSGCSANRGRTRDSRGRRKNRRVTAMRFLFDAGDVQARANGRGGPKGRSEEDRSMRRITTRRITRVRSVRTSVPSQREVLHDVLLSATECGSWLTLRELSQLTQYGEASISAQLRHLRKPKFGSYVVEKRVRRGVVLRDAEHGAIWEYHLRRKVFVGGQRNWTRKALPSNGVAANAAPSC